MKEAMLKNKQTQKTLRDKGLSQKEIKEMLRKFRRERSFDNLVSRESCDNAGSNVTNDKLKSNDLPPPPTILKPSRRLSKSHLSISSSSPHIAN